MEIIRINRKIKLSTKYLLVQNVTILCAHYFCVQIICSTILNAMLKSHIHIYVKNQYCLLHEIVFNLVYDIFLNILLLFPNTEIQYWRRIVLLSKQQDNFISFYVYYDHRSETHCQIPKKTCAFFVTDKNNLCDKK